MHFSAFTALGAKGFAFCSSVLVVFTMCGLTTVSTVFAFRSVLTVMSVASY